MVNLSGFRTIRWTAEGCNFSNARVYLGLAPGLEDAELMRMLGPDVLVRYPTRQVPITDNATMAEPIPLRLYALRDPGACHIEPAGDAINEVAGFAKFRISFGPVIGKPWSAGGSNGNHLPAASAALPSVVAFVLTIGLARREEERFFNDVILDFLDQSWSSLPRLLREIGSNRPGSAV